MDKAVESAPKSALVIPDRTAHKLDTGLPRIRSASSDRQELDKAVEIAPKSALAIPDRTAGKVFANVSASDEARQHNGDVINHTTNTQNHSYYSPASTPLNSTLSQEAKDRGLREAAANGHLPRLYRLLGIGADLDSTDSEGRTALHHACQSGFEDVVSELITRGAHVDAMSSVYGTPLCLAGIKERSLVVRKLLDARAQPDAIGGELGSPLHAACFTGNAALVNLLLESGANFEAEAVVHWERLENLRNPDQETTMPRFDALYRPVHVAADAGHVEVLNTLLDRGASLRALARLWYSQDLPESACVAFPGVSPENARSDVDPLNLAASEGRTSAVDVLINRGADLESTDSDGDSALITAAREGHVTCVGNLIRAGADVNASNKEQESALHRAAEYGNSECILVLAEFGAAVDNPDQYNQTPLMKAARNGHMTCLECLLGKGASMDRSDLEGLTALMAAARGGHTTCVEYLIAQGVPCGARDKDGWTAFHHAAIKGREECLKALERLDKSPLDIGDWNRALKLAARKGHMSTVEYLMQRRPSGDLSPKPITDAIKSASAKGHTEVTAYLESLRRQVAKTSTKKFGNSSGRSKRRP